MDAGNWISDKSIKAKEKAGRLADALLEGELTGRELLDQLTGVKEPMLAVAMEACELAASRRPDVAERELLDFAVRHLGARSPRLRWESARVIADIASLYAGELDAAVEGLFANVEHEGTVVRWSAATALTRIASLPPYAGDAGFRDRLALARDAESKNSIRKLYEQALRA